MSDNRNWAAQTGAQTGVASYDEGLRSYMLGVYNYMAIALALTGAVAYGTAASPQLIQLIFGTPLRWVVLFAPLGFVFFLSARVHAMSLMAVQATFWAFSAMMGLSLASIFLVYTDASIAKTFFITASAFGALSIFGYTTKRDLAPMGKFMFIGLVGLIIAMLVNFFLQSPAIEFAVSAIGVLIFAGLTAYDTQQIKEIYYAGDSTAVAGKKSVMGALRLYLDFINMFLFLLRFLGSRD